MFYKKERIKMKIKKRDLKKLINDYLHEQMSIPAGPSGESGFNTTKSPIPAQKGKLTNKSELNTLDKAAEPIKEFINDLVKLGYHVNVNSCYRSMGKQKELYDKLSKDPNREADVALPGSSPHNWGLGADITLFYNDKDGNQVQLGLAASNEDWLKHIDNDVISYHDYKLEWGGNFKKRDPVHFDVYPIAVEELKVRTGGYGSESMWERDSLESKLAKKAVAKGLPIDSLYSDII